MKRYKYGQNFSVATYSKFSNLQPIGFFEVAPGDTVQGKMTPTVWSDTTVKPVLNRAFYDQFVVYLPLRLLWDGWVDFITKGTGTVPTATDPQEHFFEQNVIGGTEFVPWVRYAYNFTWNNFFRREEEAEVALTSNALKLCSYRPTKFHQRVHDTNDVTNVLGVALGGMTQTARTAFAQERWDRLRDWYGDKYVDLLNAMGVQASWSITDEPEMIGKQHNDLVYRNTAATATDTGVSIGDSGGYYYLKQPCNINRTFCPEHGIVLMLGCAKMDHFNRKGHNHPIMTKDDQKDYWSPEWETELVQGVNSRLFGDTNTTGTYQAERYEEYRRPSDLCGIKTTTSPDDMYFHTLDDTTAEAIDYKRQAGSQYNALFQGTIGSTKHYCVMNEVRAVKISPVKPMNSMRIAV